MIVWLNSVSFFSQVLSVTGLILILGALVYFFGKVYKKAGKREGAQERLNAKLITTTIIVIAVILQAIAYSIQ